MAECPQVGVGGKHSRAYYDEGGTCAFCGDRIAVCGKTCYSHYSAFERRHWRNSSQWQACVLPAGHNDECRDRL